MLENMKVRNKKRFLIFIILMGIIVISTLIIVINYNKDLQECYIAIKEDYWYKFNEIIDKHFILKSDFEKKAYSKLYQAMDEKKIIIQKMMRFLNGQEK